MNKPSRSSSSPKSPTTPNSQKGVSSMRALVVTGVLGVLSAGAATLSSSLHSNPQAETIVKNSEDLSQNGISREDGEEQDIEQGSDVSTLTLPQQLPSLHLSPNVHHEVLEECVRQAQRIIHTPIPRIPYADADLQQAVDAYNDTISEKNPQFKQLREKLLEHYPNHHLVSQVIQEDNGEEHEKVVLAPRADIPSDGDSIGQSRIIIRIEHGVYTIEGSPYFHSDYSSIPLEARSPEGLEKLVDEYFSLIALKSEWWKESSHSGTEPESEDFIAYLMRNGFPNFAGVISKKHDLLLSSSPY